MKTLIKNGTLVTAADCYKADLVVEGEIITKIDLDAGTDDCFAQVIDATGCYVFPGAIDVHTHFDLPLAETTTADDFETGTVAAAFGGTTTIIDYAIQSKGQSLQAALEAWKDKAAHKAVIDYSFHMAISEATEEIINEIPELASKGVSSLKCYLAYKGTLMMGDEAVFKLFRAAKHEGMIVNVHAENGEIIDLLVREMLRQGFTGAKYHALSRPVVTEVEAVSRVLKLAELAGAPIYIVHLSSAGALKEIKNARGKGQTIFVETCPHYLYFEAGNLAAEKGAQFVMSPPLRHKDDCNYLWNNLREGHIDVVATDHATFNYRGQKDRVKNDFSKIPNGVPGVEERFSLLFTGVENQPELKLTKLVEVTATMPAKIFGLYPRKGAILVGADADLVIYDPRVNRVIANSGLHHNCDYTLYEGFKVNGAVKYVISRGDIIVDREQFIGLSGRGKFLRRNRHELVAQ